jgi:uncharacterized protein (TIGR02246 family)
MSAERASGERLAALEARLRRLEDIEAIRQLKAEYCAACDDGYDPDRLAPLFTADAVWDGGRTFGRVEGRDGIHRHFAGASARITIARHQVMNPIVEIDPDDGDRATGHWLLFQPCTAAGPDGEQAVWLAATYADVYRRVDGRWLIASTSIDVAFFSPHDRGWVDQRFLPGRAP